MTRPRSARILSPQWPAAAAEILALPFVSWLEQLKQTVRIAPSLAAAGVKREQSGRLVDLAEKDICHRTNPRQYTRADLERFLEHTW